MEDKEIWIPVDGTSYSISSLGNLRNNKSGRTKKPTPTRDGYLTYGIFCNGKNKTTQAHRLVAKHFLPDYSESLTVNHRDFNRKNNSVRNLELCTIGDNIRHSSGCGRYGKSGEANNNCKVDQIRVITIKTCAYHMTDKKIADSLGLNRKYVNDVKLGKIRGNKS